MRDPILIDKLINRPWLVLPSVHRSMLMSVIDSDENKPKLGLLEKLETEEKSYEVSGNTAIVPVFGVLGKHLSLIECMLGGCDIDGVRSVLEEAEADPAVKNIVLYINSPGGVYTGIPELGEYIQSLTKDTIAYTDSVCCSGGLWLASACDSFVCAHSVQVGSIGVYTMFLDESEMMKNMGIKVEAFVAGKYKLSGAGFKEMTDEEKIIEQESVDKIHAEFKAAVNNDRSKRQLDEKYMEGQVYDGSEATSIGMCDGTCNSINELLVGLEK